MKVTKLKQLHPNMWDVVYKQAMNELKRVIIVHETIAHNVAFVACSQLHKELKVKTDK
jgi:hypothetical protein